MSLIDRDFLEELRSDYVPEAEEYIQALVSGLLELEKRPESANECVEKLFRAAHSLKGASQAVMLPGISSICQVIESVFSKVKKDALKLSPEGFDVLQRAVDVISRMAVSTDDGNDEEVRRLVEEIEGLMQLETAPPGEAVLPATAVADEPREERPSGVGAPVPEEAPGPERKQPAQAPRASDQPRSAARETVRVASSKLDSLLLKTQELLTVNLALAVRMEDVHDLVSLQTELEREWDLAVSSLKRDGKSDERALAKVSEFLRSGRRRLRKIREKLRKMENSLRSDQRLVGGMTNELMDDARSAAMLPFSSLLSAFPKIARDLGRDLLKEVDVVIEGDGIEVDKRILEGIKDPLVHLVRNSVDHGMERPEERLSSGKPSVGKLSISVSQADGGRVEVLVQDDGRGIDPQKLRQRAIRMGAVSVDEAELMDDAVALDLIFRSGFSTSSVVTGVSGRGLGMAIVREGVESLGGRVAIDSKPGVGTSFRLTLPLALATFRGVLVEEWDELLVIPSPSLKRVGRVAISEIKRIGRKESITVDGVPTALTRLGHILELEEPERTEAPDKITFVVMEFGGVFGAFVVDRVMDEREILLKPFGRQLARVRNVSGATVLGSGRVVPVLNPADIIRSLQGTAEGRRLLTDIVDEREQDRVLVVEDSITSRTLLRNILSAAGYDVRTAADGREAWDILSADSFDAVVSDVEMPRMNGLELTAKIRSDPVRTDLPVLLVTSLESEEDRRRGAEVGADAYVVKSGFDHERLLEALRRLL
ncbi:MAG: response regulator [Synergistaceae bacterium]|nr:response regulator [Synergistota bacterium]NLM71473.1 response regulator [Synergistaceae bacterium]